MNMEENVWMAIRSLWDQSQSPRVWRLKETEKNEDGYLLITKERVAAPAKMVVDHSDELEEIYGPDYLDVVFNEYRPEDIFIHTKKVAELVGCSESYARQWLRNFRDEGLLQVHGDGYSIQGTAYTLYFIPEMNPREELELLARVNSVEEPIVAPDEISDYEAFRDFVVQYPWPSKQLNPESDQAEHVARVLWYVMKQNPELSKNDSKLEKLLRGNKLGFSQAFKQRAAEVGVTEQSIRAACTKDGYGVTQKMKEFRKLGKTLIEEWNSKRSKA